MYKSYIFGFKALHVMLPITLSSFFNIKSYLHEMRSISNFTGTICNYNNMRSFHIINVFMKLWKNLSKDVKCISFVLFKCIITQCSLTCIACHEYLFVYHILILVLILYNVC